MAPQTVPPTPQTSAPDRSLTVATPEQLAAHPNRLLPDGLGFLTSAATNSNKPVTNTGMPERSTANPLGDGTVASNPTFPMQPGGTEATAAGQGRATAVSEPRALAVPSGQPGLPQQTGGTGPRVQAAAGGSVNTLTFHGDAARTGWNANESVLTPANVAAQLGNVWNSPTLDSVTLNGTTYAPHLYASPLYVDGLSVTSGPYAGKTVGAVIAATTTGYVYAIKAFDTAGATTIPAGTILWRTSLGQPTPTIDGGVTVGVLSTPTIDLSTNRIYVTSDVTDASGRNWDIFALNLGSGSVLPGWPLQINSSTLTPINQNGPTLWGGTAAMSQRSGLNLSTDGSLLYVTFATYISNGGPGWIVAVNTRTPALASAFAGAPSTVASENAGMWGSGGPAIDSSGNVFDTTGNSPDGSNNAPGVWGNSLLEWSPSTPLQLKGTYTPWNYSLMDQNDTDLAGSSPVVIDLDPATTSTPHLAAFGSKQGNAYLVDRANLKGSLTSRPPPSTDPSSDTSLLPPGNQPQFGKPGPLNIFGPYSENSNNVDYAKSRTTPAYFKGADGSNYVLFAGSAKTAVNSVTPAAPSLVLTKIVTAPGQPAYLSVVQQNTAVMTLPGPAVISSNGTANAIAWVVDAGVMRTDSLASPAATHPTLYAYDALTLKPLWSSAHNELDVAGKYSSPTIARGTVFVGTDRIQAFGITSDTTVDDSVQGTGPNQVNYTGSGWSHLNPSTVSGVFDTTVSYTGTANDSATITFTGQQIKLYSNKLSNLGIAAVSVDGGPESMVDLYSSSDIGDVLVYTSAALSAGTHTLKVRNTGTHDASSSGTFITIDRFTISPTTVDHLSFSQQPTNTGTGSPITPAVTVQVLDSQGNLVNGDNTSAVTIGFGANPGGGSLSGTLSVTAQNGVATFSNLAISKPGTGYTLVASSANLGSTTSSPFDITQARAATVVVSSNNPSVTGSAVTFTATITANGSAAPPTGTVQWQIDGSNTGSPVAVSTTGGVTTATLSTSTLGAGTHAITANYSGDGNYLPSSGTLQQTVNATGLSTATTVTSSANPQPAGQPVRWTATVTATTGVVNFVNFETGDFSQAAAHVAGAIVTSPTLSGAYSLQLQRSNSTAYYELRQSGTTFYNLPTAYYSMLFEYTSNPGEGGIVNFQDTAGGFKAALHLSPADTLQFYNNSGTLVATGTTALAAGQVYTISAKIGTGSNAAWEVRLNGNVELSGTGNLGTANNGSVRLGGNATYTTTYYYDDVAVNSQGYPTAVPGGTVQFAIDGTNFGGPVPLADGIAVSGSTNTLTAGKHTVTASYLGDSTYAASTGTFAQTIGSAPIGSSTALSSSRNPSAVGQSVTFTATVTGSGSGTPTGSVTFLDGSTTLGQGTLSGTGGTATASFTTSNLIIGSHTITASYGGDSVFAGSTSSPLTQTVGKASTTTAVASSANPSAVGQSVTFTATVTGGGSGAPTGTVQFQIDGNHAGNPVTVTASGGVGTASFSTSSLAAGTHTVTASYSGDSNFAQCH